MVSGKQGQVFGLWMVIWVLFLCFVSVTVYLVSQGDMSSSLVSPLAVVEVQDQLALFELREQALLADVVLELSIDDFGTEAFQEELRKQFIEKFLNDTEMVGFVLDKLYLDGKDMEENARLTKRTFIENKLYPEENVGSAFDTVYFARNTIGKRLPLKAESLHKNSFPVTVYYEFGRVYAISLEGKELKVRTTLEN